MKTNWPPIGAGLKIILSFIYCKPWQWVEDTTELAATCLPRVDDHDQWNRYNPETDFAKLAKELDFPFDPAKFEQPRQVGKLWPLSIHSDASDCEDEIIVNRGLYVLWVARSNELAATLPPEEALREIQLMSEKLVHYYGINKHQRECLSEQVTEWATWLRCTHGCYDTASGALTDEGRDIAAMREFNMIGGLE